MSTASCAVNSSSSSSSSQRLLVLSGGSLLPLSLLPMPPLAPGWFRYTGQWFSCWFNFFFCFSFFFLGPGAL
ncbi:hypothetical protein BKA62DRAFT_730354 [Auriculariales sp. MPI-PUGE-AT-0066]|nr:hypothetical protein BKA62DRAFT_730354 [Auriculariales sp. MPI-PUGE-AT-0066]